MRCPYQTIITHKPEYTCGYGKHFAEDIMEFNECLKSECPFYYTTGGGLKIVEHCRRAESEGKE